jgi:hypothetical protein
VSAGAAPHFRQLQVVPSHMRDEPEGLDVVSIRAVPRKRGEVPTVRRCGGQFWD